MKLYRDYKSETEQKKQQDIDREEIGVAEETVIIYEVSSGMVFFRNVIRIVLLILLLILLGSGIAFLGLKFLG